MSYSPAPSGQPLSQPPSSNLVWAILTTLLCSLIGIVGIVYAAQVNSKWAQGDFDGARRASANARLWSIIAAVVGVVGLIVIFGLSAAGLASLPTTA